MTNVHRYHLPSVGGEGWAIIFMDSIGCFTALSDWGDVGFRWPDHGWGKGDFRQFIINCNDSYLIGKFSKGKREYDPEASLNAARALIAELTDQAAIESETDWLEKCSNLHNEHDLWTWMNGTELADVQDVPRYRPIADARHFVQHVMPRLRQILAHELAVTEHPAGEP